MPYIHVRTTEKIDEIKKEIIENFDLERQETTMALQARSEAQERYTWNFSDIFENGIVLTGGGAELFGLETMIEKGQLLEYANYGGN